MFVGSSLSVCCISSRLLLPFIARPFGHDDAAAPLLSIACGNRCGLAAFRCPAGWGRGSLVEEDASMVTEGGRPAKRCRAGL